MKNILLVSMSAPPQKGAESIQVGRYLKHLNDAFNIELVTSNTPKHSWAREDNSILKGILVKNRVELNAYKGRRTDRVLNIITSSTPEERFVNYFEEALAQIKFTPDLIYSRALPHASTLLAKKFKEHFKVPWIMHLSDPWEDNTFTKNIKGEHIVENACVNLASKVTLTSELAVQFYKNKYPLHKEKFTFMPNVYEEDIIIEDDYTNNCEHLTITHTGNFYGKRNPQVILQVLAQLSKKNKLQNIKFWFAGEMDETSKRLFKKYDIPEIELLGGVSFKESIELQQKSDILLIIDKEYEKLADLTTLPSKLLDYCATTKPILAITPKGSSTDIFINKYAVGESFQHNQIKEIKDYIESLINTFNNNEKFEPYQPPLHYGANYNVKRLIKIFNQLIEIPIT